MTRKEIVDILNQFEAEHPVDEWTVDGIHVWPMIKIDLFFRWLRKTDKRYKKGQSLAEKGNSILKKMFLTLKSFFSLFILLIRPKSKNKHILFIESTAYRSRIEGKSRNRFYHSLTSYIKENYAGFNVLFLNSDDFFNNYDQDEKICFFNKYFRALKLLSFFKNKKLVTHLPVYDDFIAVFGEKGHEVIVDLSYLNELINQIVSVKGQVFLSKVLMKKFKVKLAFELCYYSDTRYGANIAARELGVKTIEIQHGGMGPEHISYSGWTKFPEKGYSLLPSTIWLWDEVSYELINEWVSKQYYHQCVLGGNPWFSSVFNNQNKDSNEFLEDKKIILYTLQTNNIEDFILKTIQNTPSNYQWWIRMHPTKLNARDQIIQQLKDSDIYPKVILDKAAELPLPTILLNICIHISAFSGCITEAALLGKFSIILDEVGVSSYRKQIEDGMAIAELSKDENALLEKIICYSSTSSMSSQKNIDGIHELYKEILDDLLSDEIINDEI
ncbi:MAG: hypothetical protein PHQ74_11285 [Crocinitomicaceae bacterium]|nr:hypothetical protein [Crocinitomicaceae bacterium]